MLEDTNFGGRSVRIWMSESKAKGDESRTLHNNTWLRSHSYRQEGLQWFLFPFPLAFHPFILPGHFFLPNSFTLLNSPERIPNSSLSTYLFYLYFLPAFIETPTGDELVHPFKKHKQQFDCFGTKIRKKSERSGTKCSEKGRWKMKRKMIHHSPLSLKNTFTEEGGRGIREINQCSAFLHCVFHIASFADTRLVPLSKSFWKTMKSSCQCQYIDWRSCAFWEICTFKADFHLCMNCNCVYAMHDARVVEFKGSFHCTTNDYRSSPLCVFTGWSLKWEEKGRLLSKRLASASASANVHFEILLSFCPSLSVIYLPVGVSSSLSLLLSAFLSVVLFSLLPQQQFFSATSI